MKKERKTARIEIRCRPSEKIKLEKLAAKDDMSLGKYLIACGLDCGEEMRK